MTHVKFEFNNTPNANDQKIIRDGIVNFNHSVINDKANCFTLTVKKDENIIGGAIVYEHKDALYLDVVWISDKFRQQGIGSEILNRLEDKAKSKSISKLFVDTYAFQAQDFYLKHGYKVIGTAPEYLLGHDRIFMRKDI